MAEFLTQNDKTGYYFELVVFDVQFLKIEFFLEKRKQSTEALIIGSRDIKIMQMPFLRFLIPQCGHL